MEGGRTIDQEIEGRASTSFSTHQCFKWQIILSLDLSSSFKNDTTNLLCWLKMTRLRCLERMSRSVRSTVNVPTNDILCSWLSSSELKYSIKRLTMRSVVRDAHRWRTNAYRCQSNFTTWRLVLIHYFPLKSSREKNRSVDNEGEPFWRKSATAFVLRSCFTVNSEKDDTLRQLSLHCSPLFFSMMSTVLEHCWSHQSVVLLSSTLLPFDLILFVDSDSR